MAEKYSVSANIAKLPADLDKVEFVTFWGKIKGDINKQKDLMSLLSKDVKTSLSTTVDNLKEEVKKLTVVKSPSGSYTIDGISTDQFSLNLTYSTTSMRDGAKSSIKVPQEDAIKKYIQDEDYKVIAKIPTNVSQLNNDANYIEEQNLIAGEGIRLEHNNDNIIIHNTAEYEGCKIDSISVNGIEQKIVDKNVNISVPTNVSELNNDSDYASKNYLEYNYYNKDYIEDNYYDKSYIDKRLEEEYYTKDDINTTLDQYATKDDIPTKVSDLDNDKDFVTWGEIVDSEGSYTPFTKEDKFKLDSIEVGAEVNVQSDWSESNDQSDAYIKNKPSIPTKVSELDNDRNYVQSDVLDNYATKSEIPTKLSQLENDPKFVNEEYVKEYTKEYASTLVEYEAEDEAIVIDFK